MVEQRPFKALVVGSSPTQPTFLFICKCHGQGRTLPMSRHPPAHTRGSRRHRKRKSLIRWVGVAMYSAASLAAPHSVARAAEPVKTRKLGTAQFSFEEDNWASSPTPRTEPPASGTISQYPWREAIVTTTFWVGERPGETTPSPIARVAGTQNGLRITEAPIPPNAASDSARSFRGTSPRTRIRSTSPSPTTT